MSALQLTTISPISPLTTAAFGFVIVLTLIKEGLEDYSKHKFDHKLNNEKCVVYKNGKWEEIKSLDVNIGDLVLVKNSHSFTSDLLLLDSNLKDGICYIETCNLDGERNAKLKLSNLETAGIFKEKPNQNNFHDKSEPVLTFDISGIIKCNKPNSNLYELSGSLNLKYKCEINLIEKEINCDVNKNQLLLKGSILRNTKWVIGVVIYTGMNTKIMLNSNKPTMKFSKIDKILGKILFFIFFVQVILCIISACLNRYFYLEVVLTQTHLGVSKNPALDAFLAYFTYMVLLNTMIPITLIITVELVKVSISVYIKSDIKMFSTLRKR